MKATLIISGEYQHNQPSLFAYVEEFGYLGCMIYPRHHNYPTDMDYWREQSSSDTHRGFKIIDVEYSIEDLKRSAILSTVISNLKILLKPNPPYSAPPKYKVKRGKRYKEFLEFMMNSSLEYNEIYSYNRDYDKAIYKATNELRELLLKPMNNEKL